MSVLSFGRKRRPRGRKRSPRFLLMMLVAAALAALAVWSAPDEGTGPAGDAPVPAEQEAVQAFEAAPEARPALAAPGRSGGLDVEQAAFAPCGSGKRLNCVVDGDTFWYGGDKIRIADINTPEVSRPECAREARLGAAASARLLHLLNQGAFSLDADGRDEDRYGRLLRTVSRDGQSLGAILVREGLAEEWKGRRSDWC